jgi:hypothetical protein
MGLSLPLRDDALALSLCLKRALARVSLSGRDRAVSPEAGGGGLLERAARGELRRRATANEHSREVIGAALRALCVVCGFVVGSLSVRSLVEKARVRVVWLCVVCLCELRVAAVASLSSTLSSPLPPRLSCRPPASHHHKTTPTPDPRHAPNYLRLRVTVLTRSSPRPSSHAAKPREYIFCAVDLHHHGHARHSADHNSTHQATPCRAARSPRAPARRRAASVSGMT